MYNMYTTDYYTLKISIHVRGASGASNRTNISLNMNKNEAKRVKTIKYLNT